MAKLKITDPLARARKNTQAILEKSRKPSAEEMMGKAAIDVPEEAPADYGEAGAAPVLGSPYDDRLYEARGEFASPYFVGTAASESIQAGEEPVQFSGRYGQRVRNAGPEDLSLASPISKVDRSDLRYQAALRASGLADEAAPAPEPEATQAKFDYSKQQSWGDQYDSKYNYTYVPVEGSTQGIIKIEETDPTTGSTKTIVLDPRKPMSEGNTRAYRAIMEQRMGMGDRPSSVHAPQATRRQKAAENAMGVTGEAEAPVVEPVEAEPLLYDEPAGPELPPGLYDELVSPPPEPAPVERNAMKAEPAQADGEALSRQTNPAFVSAGKPRWISEGETLRQAKLAEEYEAGRRETIAKQEAAPYALEEEDKEIEAFRQDILSQSFEP